MSSLRNAINNKCKDCIYDVASPGNWRQQVQSCPSIKCPVWPFRPKSKSNRYLPHQELFESEKLAVLDSESNKEAI